MSKVDIILSVLLIGGAIAGYYAGLARMAMVLVSVLAGCFIVFQAGDGIIRFFRFSLHLPLGTSYYLTYGLCLGITLGIGLYLAKWITKALKWVFLNWLNRLAGMVFGAGLILVLECIILNLTMALPSDKPTLSKEEAEKSKLVLPIAQVFKGEIETPTWEEYLKQEKPPLQQSPGE